MISTAKCGTRSASGGHSMWTSVLFVSVMLFCIFRPASATNPYGTKVGAIRWDGWTGDVPAFDPPEYIGQNLQQAIGLNVFQYRLPFFALPTGDYSSQINGNQDWVMDAEIVQA